MPPGNKRQETDNRNAAVQLLEEIKRVGIEILEELRGARAEKFSRPSLEQIESYADAQGFPLWLASQFAQDMKNSNWRDHDRRPIDRWIPYFHSYCENYVKRQAEKEAEERKAKRTKLTPYEKSERDRSRQIIQQRQKERD